MFEIMIGHCLALVIDAEGQFVLQYRAVGRGTGGNSFEPAVQLPVVYAEGVRYSPCPDQVAFLKVIKSGIFPADDQDFGSFSTDRFRF